MSLDHAILGFLQYGPSSGYDLKASFDLSVRHFWPADQSQIYRTLSRLAERGLSEMEVIHQDERPDRKIYHITEAGRDELRRWLSTPIPHKAQHIQKLVQIFFAGQLSDEEILTMLRGFAEESRQALHVLRQVPEQAKTRSCDTAPPREQFFWMLTLEYGIAMTEANLAWLENVIARIEGGEHTRGESNEAISDQRESAGTPG